ncbi:MAG: J domain-containing protein [Treponema sp.]|jgi:DnaJ-domain-containing protein 1|nr:J domain-containing protein [Treponema sp.]
MGILDRLGNVIKSYLLDDEEKAFGKTSVKNRGSGDPDVDAAMDELNDFLGKGRKGGYTRTEYSYTEYRNTREGAQYSRTEYSRTEYSGRGKGKNDRAGGNGGNSASVINEELKADFAELGLSPGASMEECKAAYKKLLKVHHPDRHAGHAANMKKATEKTARINAAYDRIEKWRAGEAAMSTG